MSRGVAAAAAAVVLGGGLWVGSLMGRPASAAPLITLPTPTGTIPTPPEIRGGITVHGTAQVAGKPDTLRLEFSVVVSASSVAKALEQANATTAKVHATLTRNGVAAKDIRTSNLQVQPEYTYPEGGQPVIKAYTVNEGVSATLRDIGKAGAVISAVVSAGGNALQVNSISLDLSDNSSLLSAARDKAVANAKAKAEQYAKASGRRLGPVISLTETVADPPPISYAAADSAKAISAVPIAPGTQDVGVTVTVVYAFG